MNNADRFGLAKSTLNFETKVLNSPSASATRFAEQLKNERQEDKSEARGAVTPALIRQSMKPIRDIEFEYLKKYQTEVFQLIVRAKQNDLFHADFTLASRELDNYTMDFIFAKLVAVLRVQKFFVAVGTATPRSLIVSWDPILTPDSITPEERSDPKSIASIRTRRFARLQKKSLEMARDEHKTYEEFQQYLKIISESPEQFQDSSVQPAKHQEQNTTTKDSLEIDESARARRQIVADMLKASYFENSQADFYDSGSKNETLKQEALEMVRAANNVIE